jgi:hypothetical protein
MLRAQARVAIFLAVWLVAVGVRADDQIAPAPPTAPGAVPTQGPTDRPPPGLGAKQRLTDEDYARKKEGYYFTGLPLLSYDPTLGVGVGARVYFYYDGYKNSPLFAYTPYQHRVYVQTFFSSGGAQDHVIDYDAPTFLGSLYRVRATFEYEADTDWPYYSLGNRSMQPLSFPGNPGKTFNHLADYQNALSAVQPNGQTYAFYNVFNFKRPTLQLAFEQIMLGGILRSTIGTNIDYVVIKDYTGDSITASDNGHNVKAPEATTLLASDCRAGIATGCNGGFDNVLRLALSIDTRDFEPDPNSGIYGELSGEYGTKALGSQYQYWRLMASLRAFYSPIPKLADVVLAARFLYEFQTQGVPFFSEEIMPFIDDNHAGLGGFRTLRGYDQNRFVGPVMGLTNYEIRWTFTKFKIKSQGFALILCPFLDVGRVWDNVQETSFAGWKHSEGAGLRIAWNEATIIMIDYGFSQESPTPSLAGLYVNFNHIF